MTTAATDKNNLRNKVQREFTKAGSVDVGRNEAELGKFSVSQNIRVEKAWPKPAYNVFARTVTSADADPTVTPPDAAQVWDLEGYSGLHGYVVFSGGTAPSVNIELWAKDEQNDAFFFVDAEVVSASAEFRFAEKVRSRKVFLRVTNILGSPTNATVRCSPE